MYRIVSKLSIRYKELNNLSFIGNTWNVFENHFVNNLDKNVS